MSLIRIVALTAALLATTSTSAQLHEIDRSKLASDPTAQHVYDDLLPIENFARTFETNWRFPTPRAEVLDRLRSDLTLLQAEQKAHTDNSELQLLTGLTAHLAYNLDVQEAYTPAMNLLEALAPTDFRAAWFLGIHRCQSNDIVGGMNQLLGVESATPKLPGDFWQDYANCASVTSMPAHAVRAYDLADSANNGQPVDAGLESIARNRIKPTSNTTTYADRQAWSTITTGKTVQFTSTLCGISFDSPADDAVQIGSKIEGGSCYAGLETPRYKTRTKPSSATLALHSDPAPPGESLTSFVRNYMQKPDFAGAKTVAGLPCPAKECIGYELITNNVYYLQGGAHALLLFFASEPPQYPGLKLEKPIALPKPQAKSSDPTFYRPNETLQRLPGTRFFVAILDANADIYTRSRADFEAFLRSIVLDSK